MTYKSAPNRPFQVSGVPVVLETRLGDIKGDEFFFLSRKIRSFLSVPFAEPPVELQRFQVARPKRAWPSILDATKPSPACFQLRDDYNTSFWGSEMWNANTPISEDCLYLNIWAPAEAYNLAVMVWLFGGGFYSGSPSLELYDGRALASAGNVIVVNVNYRLGPFGFLYLDHPDVPGNMGLLDQQMALHWIRDHISAFGGDPGKVCLFGESAGAASIVAHLIAPASRGLFGNAILQSGSLDNKWAMDSPSRAKQKSLELTRLVGYGADGVMPSSGPGAASDAAHVATETRLPRVPAPVNSLFSDRHFFRHNDALVSLRRLNFASVDVNLMIGMNRDEVLGVQPDIVRSAAKFIYGDEKCTFSDKKNRFYAQQVNNVVGDYFFTCDSLWLAREYANNRRIKGRVYVYYFAQSSSTNPWPKWVGAMHGYEIEFVFGLPLHVETYKRREAILSRKVVQFWTSFATSGRPRLDVPKRTESWSEYDGVNNTKWMMLKSGSNVRLIEEKKRSQCTFWRRVKDAEYSTYLTETYSPKASGSRQFLFYFLFLFPFFLTRI
ncbi:unnamed protein product [Caenorhabditis auriculariae]|uniref:Carboxylic ester hydrolase n=1 Tax=Caenorhabditis auriculariae TaxID=2777116 RepID=A0A8S1HE10_9PELO|nr:unnamed protein product [Caenorhabditis auriculariae]